ncbi:hypothetical protein SeMB42_g06254 [Synchytrium endobioticum]|uniref:Uncharacterized protein n=1 Tax=Synchytrium endobioticum TaxID=286115 RepID=A0A507CLS6_9FUNG|nr:hypothetical protein SeMB42_g06254 [Synchytrium endobioticum]TPX43576.1 hypothetical protein SeLEV6574_g04976 [Synchytrium endobioticum]
MQCSNSKSFPDQLPTPSGARAGRLSPEAKTALEITNHQNAMVFRDLYSVGSSSARPYTAYFARSTSIFH